MKLSQLEETLKDNLREVMAKLPRGFVIFSLVGTVVLAGGSAFIFASIYNLRGIKSLEQYRPPTITRVYDTKGRLISEFYKERRELVPYRNISPRIIEATLATEDKRFFSHLGIDPWRIAKALVVNILAMRKEQGGSTLTIQLSKLLFLDYEKTFRRKVTELWYGIQIEKQYSKQEILSFYLNELNYGHGSYGVESAARFFFNKTAATVNTSEAALLAGIPKSPKYYSPIRYRENAMRRHKIVLLAMVQNGYLGNTEAYEVYRTFWNGFLQEFKSRTDTFDQSSTDEAPYFTEYIREKLEADLGDHELYQQGINVYTTLNLDHQRSARKHLTEAIAKQNRFKKRETKALPLELVRTVAMQVAAVGETLGLPGLMTAKKITSELSEETIEGRAKLELRHIAAITGLTHLWQHTHNKYESTTTLNLAQDAAEGAFISLEPSSGYITAMIGGHKFNYYNQFNRAMLLKRQIGSTLKPFIYSIAMEHDLITAATVLEDVPTAYNKYIPKNYSGQYYGQVLVRDALKKSINVLAIDVLHRTGIDVMRTDLSKIFLATTVSKQDQLFPDDLTLALGSGSFSPLALTTAYAVLANEGKKVLPRTIRYVTDNNGEMITNYETAYLNEAETQLISRETTFIITDIIKEVFTAGGTAFIPSLVEKFNHVRKSFGKTGTTSNWTDAWFAGANKAIAAVVWIGYDDNRSLGYNRTGGVVAAPVWLNFQIDVANDIRVDRIRPPKGVIRKTICKQLGTLASDDTLPADTYDEYFKIDTVPTEICDYRRQELDRNEEFKTFASSENKLKSRTSLQSLKAALDEVEN
ncbi:penicillin-binding protein 1A [Spirochaetota bacterium]|nr:penicillin-binding protein 1A [Spirochaetota bacterium]